MKVCTDRYFEPSILNDFLSQMRIIIGIGIAILIVIIVVPIVNAVKH